MGCDIHGWTEVKINGKWVAVCPFTDDGDERNYKRFCMLAGVRCYSDDVVCGEAKGVPSDVSETVRYHIDQWDSDGHSHSHMTLLEALRIFKETATSCWRNNGFIPEDAYDFFGVEENEDFENMRIVFWFDN